MSDAHEISLWAFCIFALFTLAAIAAGGGGDDKDSGEI